MLMADHLNAHSGALHIAERQDGLPSGSDVILAAFQIKKLLSFGLTSSHTGAKDFTDEKQHE